MRILIVSPYFYPAQYFGGPVQAILKLGKELVKRNHEVEVFTSDAKNLNQRLDIENDVIEGIQVHYLRNMSMFSAKASRLFITPELCKKLRSELPSFDIAYANEYTTFQNIILHKFARQYDVPYVIQARGSIPKIGRTARKTIYDAFFGRRLLRNASANIALTKAEFHQYENMGVPSDQIVSIPNGVNLKEFELLPPRGLLREKFNIPEEKKIVLSLGRIHEIKGLDVLVKAFAYGKEKGNLSDAILVISGSDDGYLDNLKSLVQNLNLSGEVVFTGPLYGDDKLAAYVDSYVVVLPSYYETFPNVVLEANGCSKPVIASNVESISDIVLDRDTGLLFESGDYKGLADMLSLAFSNPEETCAMGLRASKLVESKYSMDRVVDLFERVFEDVLSKPTAFGNRID
jgi:glycosyltransferase involved in cell wall biosynthesis